MAVLFALAGVGASGVARADVEETEARLKSAGVDAGLRARVHTAIGRAVEFLVAQQDARGRFRAQSHRVGSTLLAALALRHAGTGPTVEPVARTQAYLFGDKADVRAVREMEEKVYCASLALLFLQAIDRRAPEAPVLAAGLSRALDPIHGAWGYDIPPPTSRSAFAALRPNLSTSQFAALGLWAAARMGVAVPAQTWRAHAASLIEAQRGGASPYWPRTFPAGENDPYLCGTAMGVANLLLARQALAATKGGSPDRGALDAAIQRGLAALRRDAPPMLAKPATYPLWPKAWVKGGLVSQEPGMGPYYALYAIEKACVFADVESLGGRPWYASMADWLCSTQAADGGWTSLWDGERSGESDVVETSFALLILVRAPQTSHPTTPRLPDARPRGPVTGEPAPPK
ncbi:MAG: hypothetical protein IT460_03655 [Planctomycetes bacterium]|nr:hypothetical protein [Planctomycetota bacterium]